MAVESMVTQAAAAKFCSRRGCCSVAVLTELLSAVVRVVWQLVHRSGSRGSSAAAGEYMGEPAWGEQEALG